MDKRNIKINLPKNVKYIIDKLENNKFKAYIVGGSVRDSILQRNVYDWDIATNARPQEIINLFENTIPTGLKHGTVTIVIDNEGFEVTTFRTEGTYTDNRHPDIVNFITSLKEDLSRRDFTINSMAYSEREGLIDYFGGLIDLENKVIRCVGNPIDRFNEDALRMMRCIRFSSQLDFNIEIDTWRATSLLSKLIINISKERIRDELCKILVSDNPRWGIMSLELMGLLKYIIPELEDCYGFNQYNKHHDKDVFNHILSVVRNTPPKLELRLSALLHDIGKPKCFTMGEDGQGHFFTHHKISADMSREILTRLKFDNKTIDKVCVLIYEHMTPTDLNDKSIKKLIKRVGEENIYDLIELITADRKGMAEDYNNYCDVYELGEKINLMLFEKQPLSVHDLAINGKDLMNLGYKQGKEIGIILNKLLELVLENPKSNNKEYLIEYINNIN